MMENEDLQAPTEIYSRYGGAPPASNNVIIPRSGISDSASEFNSGV